MVAFIMGAFCARCELNYGSKREDGSVVEGKSLYSEKCTRCVVIEENADEEAFIAHEKSKIFG